MTDHANNIQERRAELEYEYIVARFNRQYRWAKILVVLSLILWFFAPLILLGGSFVLLLIPLAVSLMAVRALRRTEGLAGL